MKNIILLLFLLTISFSYYLDPPFSGVKDSNLNNLHLTSYLSENKSNLYLFNQSIASIDEKIVDISPSVDRRISGESRNLFIWAYGESHQAELTESDYDSDSCKESATFSGAYIEKEIKLSFRNKSITLINPDPAFELPVSLDLNSTEGDTLNIKIQIIGYYNYTVLDLNPSAGKLGTICDGEYQKKSFQVASISEQNYSVEGGSVILLKKSPVLGDQWFRNNHFDELVFSKRKFSLAEILMDNEKVQSLNLHYFDVINDPFDFKNIISVKNQNLSQINYTESYESFSPQQLQKSNESFSVIYLFNYTYNGVNLHNLTLKLKDDFGNEYSGEETLLSRYLSSFGVTEPGALKQITIKSPEFSIDKYIIPGSVGLVIIILISLLYNNPTR